MFSLCLLVYRITQKAIIVNRFSQNVAYGPRKNPLDVGGNPEHVTLRLGLG